MKMVDSKILPYWTFGRDGFRFSQGNGWPDSNPTIFIVLYMYGEFIGYSEMALTICKYMVVVVGAG